MQEFLRKKKQVRGFKLKTDAFVGVPRACSFSQEYEKVKSTIHFEIIAYRLTQPFEVGSYPF